MLIVVHLPTNGGPPTPLIIFNSCVGMMARHWRIGERYFVDVLVGSEGIFGFGWSESESERQESDGEADYIHCYNYTITYWRRAPCLYLDWLAWIGLETITKKLQTFLSDTLCIIV